MNPWKTLNSKVIEENAWFKILKDKVITPSGKSGEYTYMVNIPFVMVIGITPSGFVMVKEYRYTIKQIMTTFVAGSCDKGESSLAAAKRELQEETGYIAKKWTDLGHFYVSISANDHKGQLFLAEELTQTDDNKMSEDGIESAITLSQGEIENKIAKLEISDTTTVAAYFKVKLHLAAR